MELITTPKGITVQLQKRGEQHESDSRRRGNHEYGSRASAANSASSRSNSCHRDVSSDIIVNFRSRGGTTESASRQNREYTRSARATHLDRNSNRSSGCLRDSDRSGTQAGRMEESGIHDSGFGSGSGGAYNRSHRRRVLQWIRSDAQLTKVLLPFSPLILGGWAPWNVTDGAISKLFHFSMEDVAREVRYWLQERMEDWYHFIGTVFESVVDLILYTPITLISNAYVQKMWWIFVGITVGVLMVMCIVEAIRMVLGLSHSNFLQFLGRSVMAFLGMTFTLPTMTYGLDFVNRFVQYFMELSMGHVKTSQFVGESLSSVFANAGVGLFVSIIFLVLFLYYMFRVLLYYGRRWFDILVATVISPLAFGSMIFETTAHYFQQWWSHVVQLYMVQIVHAVYVGVLAAIVLAPSFVNDTITGFFKILLLIGALWRMSTPPRFVSAMSGSPDSRDMLRGITRKFVKLKTLGKFSVK